jgi:hypothetical protein
MGGQKLLFENNAVSALRAMEQTSEVAAALQEFVDTGLPPPTRSSAPPSARSWWSTP